jgi:group II intron reverse transcriptase/maturase
MSARNTVSTADAALFPPAAFYRAWQQVRRNGQSPGVDHVSAAQFGTNLRHELGKLRAELIERRYRPRPVQRYYKRKASGKRRALSIWTIRDRVAQRVILEHITPTLEALYLACSYGFRPGRRLDQAWAAVMDGYQRGLRWVVDADIADCFDAIPLPPLMERVRAVIPSGRVVELIDGWLHTPIAGQAGKIAGVSQGAVISPQLTNLYLHRLDVAIVRFPAVKLVRFADDFVILCPNRAVAHAALQLARWTLRGMELSLNEQKTRIVQWDQGFNFLGAQFGAHGYRVISNEAEEQ